MIKCLTNALNYAATKTGFNLQKAQEYLDDMGYDRRYKLFVLTGNVTWSYNNTGIIKYRNRKYYYQQSEGGFNLVKV